jgi:enoyl-CoA hydratase/carnithine racemase
MTEQPVPGQPMPDRPRVDYRNKDHVAWVTMDRPEVPNATDLRMHQELAGAGGRAFSVGQDLKERARLNREGAAPTTFGGRMGRATAALRPLSLRAIKESVLKSVDLPLEQSFSTRYEWEERRMHSRDAREGPQAFAEKRDPEWEGH